MNIDSLIIEQRNFFTDLGGILAKRFSIRPSDYNSENVEDRAAKDFSEYIRASRMALGWSRRRLAEEADLSEAEIVAIEHGLMLSTRIRVDLLRNLAIALDDDVEMFGLLLERDISTEGVIGSVSHLPMIGQAIGAYFGSKARTATVLVAMLLSILIPSVWGANLLGVNQWIPAYANLTQEFIVRHQISTQIVVCCLTVLWVFIRWDVVRSSHTWLLMVYRVRIHQRRIAYLTPVLLLIVVSLFGTMKRDFLIQEPNSYPQTWVPDLVEHIGHSGGTRDLIFVQDNEVASTWSFDRNDLGQAYRIMFDAHAKDVEERTSMAAPNVVGTLLTYQGQLTNKTITPSVQTVNLYVYGDWDEIRLHNEQEPWHHVGYLGGVAKPSREVQVVDNIAYIADIYSGFTVVDVHAQLSDRHSLGGIEIAQSNSRFELKRDEDDVHVPVAEPGSVIIVAGRYELDDDLQNNIHHVTDRVYRSFNEGTTTPNVYGWGGNVYTWGASNRLDSKWGDAFASVEIASHVVFDGAWSRSDAKVGDVKPLDDDAPLTIYMMSHGGFDYSNAPLTYGNASHRLKSGLRHGLVVQWSFNECSGNSTTDSINGLVADFADVGTRFSHADGGCSLQFEGTETAQVHRGGETESEQGMVWKYLENDRETEFLQMTGAGDKLNRTLIYPVKYSPESFDVFNGDEDRKRVEIVDNIAYLSDGYHGLVTVDLSEPKALIGSEDTQVRNFEHYIGSVGTAEIDTYRLVDIRLAGIGSDSKWGDVFTSVDRTAPEIGALVVVAGRENNHDLLQWNIHEVTNEVYRLFAEHKHSSRIHHLVTTFDSEPLDDNVLSIYEAWSGTKTGDDVPLTLYMISHGGFDYSDAPLTYGSASHQFVGGLWLGSAMQDHPDILVAPCGDLNCDIEVNIVDGQSDIFEQYIRHMYSYGIVSGYASGVFRPDESITRGEVSKIIVRWLSFDSPSMSQQLAETAAYDANVDGISLLNLLLLTSSLLLLYTIILVMAKDEGMIILAFQKRNRVLFWKRLRRKFRNRI